MFIHNKEKLEAHPMLQKAVTLSEMTTKAKWLSIYRNKDGEMAINFAGKLTKNQIKTILMHFKDLLDGDTDVSAISCEYNIDYQYSSSRYNKEVKEHTLIFTPEGYNYSNC